MNFDQMIETWRTQDAAPLFGVNRDLLQLVVKNEQADLRRGLRWEVWAVYGTSAGLLALFVFFAAVVFYGNETVGDYAATALSLGATLLWAGAYWVSRRRQALRERAFGNSLQEEVRRNLSLIDYQLSRTGRWTSSLLFISPVLVATVLLLWFGARINEQPFGWDDAAIAIAIIAGPAAGVAASARQAERKLTPRRNRLAELLELLNAEK